MNSGIVFACCGRVGFAALALPRPGFRSMTSASAASSAPACRPVSVHLAARHGERPAGPDHVAARRRARRAPARGCSILYSTVTSERRRHQRVTRRSRRRCRRSCAMMPPWTKPFCCVRSSRAGARVDRDDAPARSHASEAPISAIAFWRAKLSRTRCAESAQGGSRRRVHRLNIRTGAAGARLGRPLVLRLRKRQLRLPVLRAGRRTPAARAVAPARACASFSCRRLRRSMPSTAAARVDVLLWLQQPRGGRRATRGTAGGRARGAGSYMSISSRISDSARPEALAAQR